MTTAIIDWDAEHSQIDQAIQNLQQAINLNPDEYREMAKTDSDFDSLRFAHSVSSLDSRIGICRPSGGPAGL